jgi:benzoyl-CoA reductase/2-hydroxyglutaryl-CoA dehydratase subunit BcrC/BadD/HgdB
MQLNWPPARKAYIEQQQTIPGRKIFGVFPAVYPKELLWAFNILPVEIWDPPLEVCHTGAHLQPTICSVVRQGLELILQGKCRDLDGFLFPHTCDSLQNLAAIVHDCLALQTPCYFFYPPRGSSRSTAFAYYLAQLKHLADALSERFGPLERDEFKGRVIQGQSVADRINHLYDLRARGELALSNTDFYRVLRSGEYLSPEDHLQLMDDCMRQAHRPSNARPGVLLSGVLPNPPEILSLLDAHNVRIAEDDLLNCSRRLRFQTVQDPDPYRALAAQYFSLPPCSTRNATIGERLDYLLQKIELSGARGVIFYIVGFCEPELFDIPQLTAALKKRDIKTLMIDVEVNRGFSGQLATRVEAFLETLI